MLGGCVACGILARKHRESRPSITGLRVQTGLIAKTASKGFARNR